MKDAGCRTGILLLAAGVLPYINALGNGLFLDDLDFIVNNLFIRDWHYLPQYFTQSMTAGAGHPSDYYRPLMQVFFAAAHSLWDLNPMGYHLLSAGFHALNTLLLFTLLQKIVKDYRVCLLTALLFALHPAQTEAVASASALGILLGHFFALLAALAHLKSRESRLYLPGGLLAEAAALLSKETLVTIPGMIFLIEFCFLTEARGLKKRLAGAFMRSLPYLLLSGIYVALRFTLLDFGGSRNLFRQENAFTQSVWMRTWTFFSVFKELLKIIFWPHPLYMERSTTLPLYPTLFAWPVISGFLIFISMLGAAVFSLYKEREAAGPAPRTLVGFGILWFLAGLLPVSNVFIPISTTIVESWLYTPAVGIFLIAALILSRLPKPLFVFAAASLSAVCFAKTVSQNRIWRDPVTFYEHNLRLAPESARFHNNLAMAYADRSRYLDAIARYQAAIRLNNQYPETHHNLANAYAALAKLPEAEAEYRTAIRMNPRFFHSYLGLAGLYLRVRNTGAAEKVLEDLVREVPERWEGYYQLGTVKSMKGDMKEAASIWEKGLAADPHNPALREALSKSAK